MEGDEEDDQANSDVWNPISGILYGDKMLYFNGNFYSSDAILESSE